MLKDPWKKAYNKVWYIYIFTNHNIHHLKALSLKFYTLNFLSWPNKSSASWLKRVCAIMTKKCHANCWTAVMQKVMYIVHSWPSWKIGHDSVNCLTVGTTLLLGRERQVLLLTNKFLELRVCTAPNYKDSKFWGLALLWDSKR